MQTAWDYTHLASAYLKRPDYAQSVIDALVRDLPPGARACDIGAGTGHLTRRLRAAGLKVTAVEPNDAMRSLGRKHSDAQVQWHEGTGEATGQPDHTFALVTFGSSFNVTDRTAALHECQRILAPGGIFACMWNHRDLDDPIQAHIESIIHAAVPDYDYGTRRADQREFLEASGMFGPVQPSRGPSPAPPGGRGHRGGLALPRDIGPAGGRGSRGHHRGHRNLPTWTRGRQHRGSLHHPNVDGPPRGPLHGRVSS